MKYLDLIDLLEGDTTAEIEKLTAQLDADRPALAAAEKYCQQSEQGERDHNKMFNAAQQRHSALAAQVSEMQTAVFDSAMRDALLDDDLEKFSALKNRFIALSEAVECFRVNELRDAHREMLIARITHLGLVENRYFTEHALEILKTTAVLKNAAAQTGGMNLFENNLETPISNQLLTEAFDAASSKANFERLIALHDNETARLRS